MPNGAANNSNQADQKNRVSVLFNLKAVVSVFSAAYCLGTLELNSRKYGDQ